MCVCAKKINLKNNKGVALIITILLMSLILFLSIYFLSFSVTEKKIAHSQTLGAKTYYLAEAGIAEMVWLLKNNETYKNNFETDPNWAANFTRDNPFGADSGSYTVTITNSSLAHGEIVSVGAINIDSDKTSQRIIKTNAYKALGESGVEDNSGYADGNIDISSSNVNFFNGSAQSNNVFEINNSSNVNIASDLNSVGNYNEHKSVNVLIAGDIYAANYPLGPADEILMPATDFDYYKNLAIASSTYYTEAEFEDYLKSTLTPTLNNAVTYVSRDVKIKGGRVLTINEGLLVVDRDFEIGSKQDWEGGSGPSSIIINHSSSTPSGILAGRHVDFKQYTGEVDVDGVIYASDLMNLSNLDSYTTNFDIIGGLIARKLTITSCWLPTYVNITHDNEILVDVLGATSFSRVVTVEHWEEEY